MVFICQSHIVCFGSLSCSLVKGNNKLMSCTMWLLQHMRPQPMRLKWKSSMQALLHDMNYFILAFSSVWKEIQHGPIPWYYFLCSLRTHQKSQEMDHVMGRWFLATSVFLCFHVFMIAPAFPSPPWRYIWGWMGTYCRTRTSIQWIPACHGALARDWGRGCWCKLFSEIYIHPENQHIPWKMMVARCISYWNSPFSGFFRGHVSFWGCSWPVVDEILSIYLFVNLYKLCIACFWLKLLIKAVKKCKECMYR